MSANCTIKTYLYLVTILISVTTVYRASGQPSDSLLWDQNIEEILDFLTGPVALEDEIRNELTNLEDQDSTQFRADQNRSGRSSAIISQSIHHKLDLPAGFNRPYQEGGYLGSPTALFTRLHYESTSGISIRLAMEKDAGELISWNPDHAQYGFDHFTGAFSLNSLSFIENVIVGDYLLSFGQGLGFARPFSSGKGAIPTESPFRNATQIRPSASRSEGTAFRGVVATIRFSNTVRGTAFYSSRHRDASLAKDSSGAIATFQTTGLHRTIAERKRKAIVHEKMFGANLSINSSLLKIGLSGYSTTFSRPLSVNHLEYKSYKFSGSILAGSSLYAQYLGNSWALFGELATSFPGSIAFITGGRFTLPDRTELLLLWRRYSPRYYSLYASGFAERSPSPRNERGLYAAFSIPISSRLKWSSYFDQYTFPWISSSLRTPTSGFEFWSILEYMPRGWLSVSTRYLYRIKPVSYVHHATPILSLRSSEHRSIHGVRAQLEYMHSDILFLRSRLDFKFVRTGENIRNGIMIYQDFVYNPFAKSRIQARFSQFNSDGQESTLYALENDLRFRYSLQTFSGRGRRNFILLRQRLGKQWTLELKYSETQFDRAINKSSGNEAYSGRRLRELHMQIIWKA